MCAACIHGEELFTHKLDTRSTVMPPTLLRYGETACISRCWEVARSMTILRLVVCLAWSTMLLAVWIRGAARSLPIW